jgi:putative acetyltransferase
MVEIRDEREGDQEAIRRVHLEAFGGDLEARLVELLRDRGNAIASLVAVRDGDVVGHVMFSLMTIERADGVRGVGLAPVGVLPPHQRHGIGSSLVREGVLRCTRSGFDLVFLLGDPRYYSRFGFMHAKAYGFGNEYGVDEEFMVLELQQGALTRAGGLVRYPPEFAEVSC